MRSPPTHRRRCQRGRRLTELRLRADFSALVASCRLVLERASGNALDAFFQDEIFGALGMTESGFRLVPEDRKRLVPPYLGTSARLAEPGVADFRRVTHETDPGRPGLDALTLAPPACGTAGELPVRVI